MARLTELEATVAAMGRAVDGNSAWLGDLETWTRSVAADMASQTALLETAVTSLGRAVEGNSAWLRDFEAWARAVAADVATQTGLLEATVASVSQTGERNSALLGEVETSMRSATDALTTRNAQHDATVAAIGQTVEGNSAWLGDLDMWMRSAVQTLAAFGSAPIFGDESSVAGEPAVAGRLLAWMDVWTVMHWIRGAAIVDEDQVVSVIVPTRDRPAHLTRALASIFAQSYGRFELIVVDDSDHDATAELLDGLSDPRLRVVRHSDHRGVGAALNTGLDAVRGDIVASLDDDNLMHPDWLRSVVWAFAQHPDTEALYGARIIEDPASTNGLASGMLPALEFWRYDRTRHESANYVDRNTVAFRARHADLRYDESVPGAEDWDHALRLFARSAPLALPTVACYYRTLHSGRLSDQSMVESVRTVRSRARRRDSQMPT